MISIDRPARHVMSIVIDRPPVNAIDRVHQRELAAAFEEASTDLDIRAVVVRGSGRAFCAGADLREEQAIERDEVDDLLGDIGMMLRSIAAHRVPVIAAVNGAAHGGGLELALSCDLRIGSTEASFGAAGVNVGLIANFSQLRELIGSARASHMLLTGWPVRAEQALDWGLLTELHEPDALDDAALRVAERIASRAPLSVEATKSAMRRLPDLDQREARKLQGEEFARLFRTHDHAEALEAFFERRPSEFHRR